MDGQTEILHGMLPDVVKDSFETVGVQVGKR